MAQATAEVAFWGLWSKSLDLPLQTVLGGTGAAIDVGVSLGFGQISDTLDRVAAHLQPGYMRIKLKVKPSLDLGDVYLLALYIARLPLYVDPSSAQPF